MGRSGKDPTAGRQFTWDFIADHFADPYGDLFYHSDTFPADPAFSGYGECPGREEKGQEQSVIFSDSGRIDSDQSWHGKSGRCSCCDFSRWSRCCILDVGDSTDRFIHGIYRSDTGTAL